MPQPLVDSPHLLPVPSYVSASSVVVTPSSYATWAACISGNLGVQRINVKPGDYTSWGTLDIRNKGGGSSGSWKSIAYFNEGTDDDTHPVQRSNQAVLADFNVNQSGSVYWCLRGLTFAGGGPNQVGERCQNVLLDMLHVTGSNTNYGIRVRQTNHVWVQRCTLLDYDNVVVGVDSTGIQVGNIDWDVDDIHILDCEIRNYGDCIQLTDGPNPERPVEVHVDGCDLYQDGRFYLSGGTKSPFENAIDMKAGSDTSGSVKLTNNRIWGMRRNAATPVNSLGEGIVVQRYCRNVIISGNIIADCPKAIKDENWPVLNATTFTADHTTGVLTTATNHGLVTPAGPLAVSNVGGGLPTGLAGSGTLYWAIRVDATNFKLASSRDNACASSSVTFSDDGSGTQHIAVWVDRSRDMAVNGNWVCDIRSIATYDSGSAFVPITDAQWTNNVVSRCDYLVDQSPSVYRGAGPYFAGNVLTDVGGIQRPEDQTPPVPYTASLNTVVDMSTVSGWDTYERKRWTGREFATGAVTSASPSVSAGGSGLTYRGSRFLVWLG